MHKFTIGIDFKLEIMDRKSINSSFDWALVRVAYHGRNRNRSEISKEAFEKALPSLFNVPLVGNYLPEDDNFGGHDLIWVKDGAGKVSIQNATTPFGVVPESAQWHWEDVIEEDGTAHEYLFSEVILWKRQYGYETLIKQTSWGQSMEIGVYAYHTSDDDYCVITEFEYEALCILGNGIEPCFESASVQLGYEREFAYRADFSQMLIDYHNIIGQTPVSAGFDIKRFGEKEDGEKLEETNEEQKAEAKVEELPAVEEEAKEPEAEVIQEESHEFSLNTLELVREIEVILQEPTIVDSWGYEWPRYWLIDIQDSEIIVCDAAKDWKIYGFKFSVNGDAVNIDFESATRKKTKYVDFEGEESPEEPVNLFSTIVESVKSGVQKTVQSVKDEYAAYQAEHKTPESEVNQLKAFKQEKDKEVHELLVDEVLVEFPDLADVKDFMDLKDVCYNYQDLEALREKCFAIRGRQAPVAKFEKQNTKGSLRISVDVPDVKETEGRYGDLFMRFSKGKDGK